MTYVEVKRMKKYSTLARRGEGKNPVWGYYTTWKKAWEVKDVQVTFKQRGFEPHGSTERISFFCKHLSCFGSAAGSLQQWRAGGMPWSSPFYVGAWTSVDFGIHPQGLDSGPHGYQGTTEFWWSQELCVDFWLDARQCPNPPLCTELQLVSQWRRYDGIIRKYAT